MEMSIAERIKNAWNVFKQNDDNYYKDFNSSYMGSYGYRPDRFKLSTSNEKSVVNSICNRIAMDVSSISIRHVVLDDKYRFKDYTYSSLDDCLTLSANKDQTGRAFIQDVVMSLLDDGCVAIVPVDMDPKYDEKGEITEPNISSLRVGRILEWYPDKIKVDIYNENTGEKEQIIVNKLSTAIIENPLYAVMNETNGTLRRLVEKMNLMDVIDQQIGAGKLDMIMKLPYAVRSEAKRMEADRMKKDLEEQLKNSKYGIGYVDSQTEIIQLNRSVENNLMSQIDYLTKMLYGQLGLSEEILNGTADEQAMLNYNSRTIEPIISAIVDEIKRKFISKYARNKKQTIMFFKDPFKLVPVNNIAEIADKFTRNEIVTSNEMRQVIGMAPSDDPKADELRNKNLSQSMEALKEEEDSEEKPETNNKVEENQNGK